MADNKQRGLVRIASMDIETRSGGLQTGTRAIAAGTGIERTFDTAATEVSRIGTQIGRLADHAAAVEGREAGSLAGLDPEFRPSRSLTIRGEAFDKAGLDVWGSRHKQAMLDDVEGLHMRHGADPRALNAAIEKKRGAWLSAVPDPMRAEMTLAFDRAKATAVRQATRQQLADYQAEQKAAAAEDLTASMKRLHQQAYSLGLDAKADEHISSASMEIDKLMARRDATGKPLFTPAQARRVMEDLRQDVAQARILGTLERTATPEGKQAILDGFREEFGKSDGLGGLFGLDKFRAVERMIEAEVRTARSEVGARGRLVEDAVKRVAEMAVKGQVVRPEDMSALRTSVMTVAPHLQGDLSAAEDTLQFVQSAQKMSPDGLAQVLRDERARLTTSGGPLTDKNRSDVGWARLEVGEKLLENMRREIKEDAVAWHARVNPRLIQPLLLDPAQPAVMEQSFRARIAAAKQVATDAGHAVQYLTNEEAGRLASVAGRGGDDLLIVSSMIASAGEAAPQIMAEIGKHGPATAFVGGLVVAQGGPTAASRDAAAGMGLMKLDGFKSRLPSQRIIETAAIEEMGTALRATKGNSVAVLQVANAIYEARALRTGKNDDVDLWKQALREALGEREVGGEKFGGLARGSFWGGWHDPVPVPPWLKQSGLKSAIDALTEDDIKAHLGGMPKTDKGAPLPISAIRRGRLIAVGSGRYVVATSTDPDDPQPLGGDGPDGLFVLDLGRLRPAIQKRRPDLVAGGR